MPVGLCFISILFLLLNIEALAWHETQSERVRKSPKVKSCACRSKVMLHETSVSWMRHRLTISTPVNPATETREEYVSRLKRVCAEIHANYDLEGLSRAFPSRVQAVKAAEGDRIAK